MVVASLLHGRMRVRDAGLKKDALAAQVTDALLETPGVASAEVNLRVGSLLVLYDAAVVGAQAVLDTISGFLGSPEEEVPVEEAQGPSGRSCCGRMSLSVPPAVRRRIVNLGMMASLALSVAAAVFDLKKLHVLAGIVFLALFGDHFLQKKERVFA